MVGDLHIVVFPDATTIRNGSSGYSGARAEAVM